MRRGRACAIVVVLSLAALAAGTASGARASNADAAAAAASSTSSSAALVPGPQVTIRYCNNQEARITEPATLHGPAPAAVYVHGGSWVSGDYDTGGFIINRIGPALAARGFVVVSLNYRLGPRWTRSST
jgi:acetyl esterase/lipase